MLASEWASSGLRESHVSDSKPNVEIAQCPALSVTGKGATCCAWKVAEGLMPSSKPKPGAYCHALIDE